MRVFIGCSELKAAVMNQVPADPTVLHPFPDQPRVVLLKPLVTSPLIEAGEYSYYDDPDEPTAFETRNVLYHYGPERLVIGKFCALGNARRSPKRLSSRRLTSACWAPAGSARWRNSSDSSETLR
jgi:hypothetical protein